MPEPLTMNEIVGYNVRRIREALMWSQQRLRDELEDAGGISWSRATVAQTELGKRPITVNELLALALVLGVAPHLLLYPPPGTDVMFGRVVAQGEWLADLLWDPDQSDWTRFPESEQRRWILSSNLLDRLDPEAVQQLTAEARDAEERKDAQLRLRARLKREMGDALSKDAEEREAQ
jgi:hypothetical protein